MSKSKSGKNLGAKYKNIALKIFWPWFKKFAWPIIRKNIEYFIIWFSDLFKKETKKWFSHQMKENEEKAKQKAEEFENKSNHSKNEAEAEKLQSIAQVWREVAEQFRQENETLERKIDELSRELKEETFKKADSLEFDLVFSDEKPALSIGGSTYRLTQLPSKDNDEKV
jgi:hypothetical protein